MQTAVFRFNNDIYWTEHMPQLPVEMQWPASNEFEAINSDYLGDNI